MWQANNFRSFSQEHIQKKSNSSQRHSFSLKRTSIQICHLFIVKLLQPQRPNILHSDGAIMTRWNQRRIIDPGYIKNLIRMPFHTLNQSPCVTESTHHQEEVRFRNQYSVESYLFHRATTLAECADANIEPFGEKASLLTWKMGELPKIVLLWLTIWTCPNCWHWIWDSNLPDVTCSNEIVPSSLPETKVSPSGLQKNWEEFWIQGAFQETWMTLQLDHPH
jgi:hypothetical protein